MFLRFQVLNEFFALEFRLDFEAAIFAKSWNEAVIEVEGSTLIVSILSFKNR